ncbi:hypothetical protein Tco_0331368 [Tanacetum coccineum]
MDVLVCVDFKAGGIKPLLVDTSPTVLSPGNVADFDPSEVDPKEDPADYPADEGDDDDDDDDGEEHEEEEEHLAPADSTTLPAINPVPLAKDTEAFEIDESAPTPPSPPTHTDLTYAEAPLYDSVESSITSTCTIT